MAGIAKAVFQLTPTYDIDISIALCTLKKEWQERLNMTVRGTPKEEQ